ncbi:hypothetical protein Hanom_Chr11g01043061 [Helianthus anomalus]
MLTYCSLNLHNKIIYTTNMSLFSCPDYNLQPLRSQFHQNFHLNLHICFNQFRYFVHSRMLELIRRSVGQSGLGSARVLSYF